MQVGGCDGDGDRDVEDSEEAERQYGSGYVRCSSQIGK